MNNTESFSFDAILDSFEEFTVPKNTHPEIRKNDSFPKTPSEEKLEESQEKLDELKKVHEDSCEDTANHLGKTLAIGAGTSALIEAGKKLGTTRATKTIIVKGATKVLSKVTPFGLAMFVIDIVSTADTANSLTQESYNQECKDISKDLRKAEEEYDYWEERVSFEKSQEKLKAGFFLYREELKKKLFEESKQLNKSRKKSFKAFMEYNSLYAEVYGTYYAFNDPFTKQKVKREFDRSYKRIADIMKTVK